MQIRIVTLFPELVESVGNFGVVGRGVKEGVNQLLSLIWALRALERIGDHATGLPGRAHDIKEEPGGGRGHPGLRAGRVRGGGEVRGGHGVSHGAGQDDQGGQGENIVVVGEIHSGLMYRTK